MLITTPLLTMRQLKRRMKKITRSVTTASTVAPAPNQEDIVNVTALAGNLTVANPTGACVDGQKFVLRVAQDAAGSHTITWGSAYAFGTDITALGLPTTGAAWWEVVFRLHAGTGKWRAIEWARSVGSPVIPPDTEAPTLTSATIDAVGTSMTLVFSEAVTAGTGGYATFTSTLSGGAVALTYASGGGTDTLVMTISRTVYSGETGVVEYAASGAAVADAAGNALETITAAAVTNNSTQVVAPSAPTMSSATIDAAGTALTLNFSEAVSIGAGGNTGFTITPSGGAATLTYASGTGTANLVYTISRAIAQGETATLAYTQPGNGVEDGAGDDLSSFSGVSVTNSSTYVAPTPPTLSTATIAAAGTSLTLHFNETVTVGVGGNAGFVLTASGGAAALTYSSGSGSANLVYTIGRTIAQSETATLAYTQPGNGVEDTDGADLASFSGAAVTNSSTYVPPTPPTLSSATINAAGTSLTLAFSEAVSVGAGGNAGFAITASGGAASLTYASGSGTASLVYTIGRAIVQGETATLAYTQPGNGIEDGAGDDLASFSGTAVTNNSTHTAGTTGWVYSYPTTDMNDPSPLSSDNYVYNQRITADKTTTVDKVSLFMVYANANMGAIKMVVLSGDGTTALGSGTLTPSSGGPNMDVEVTLSAAVNVTAGQSYIIQYGFSQATVGSIGQGTVDGPDNSHVTIFDKGYADIPLTPVSVTGKQRQRVGIHQQ